jgi:DNA (cytosine-5)-methyltransferase 1
MSGRAYYNEIVPYCAAWLRNLIAAGHIAPGEVDERSIIDVRPADLDRFDQCHFFAGIGGWSYAARLAGWPDDRPLWTGSCPCQPFSVAGKGEAQADTRHLWSELFRLVAACRPAVVMGEQVAAAVGKDWLDGVCADLEGVDYAIGAAVVPACAVDAPHRRDRLWFVADINGAHCDRERRPSDASFSRSEWVLEENGAKRRIGIGELVAMGIGEQAPSYAEARRLVHGDPTRVGRLRAYGNAIVPPLAAEVIGAYLDTHPRSPT